MCKCTPQIRTPFCGKPGCEWPQQYEAPRNPRDILRVRGVGRIADEPRAVLVALSERPTDDEIRGLHEVLRGWSFRDGSAALVNDKDLEWIADIIFIAKRDDGNIYDTARKIVAYLAGGL